MDIVAVYEELADFEEQRGESQPRDRFLILAADAALAGGDNDRAEQIRARLLDLNPHHLLRPYSSLADALKAPDVFGYVADLQHSYPPAEAERLLASLRGGGPGAEDEPVPGSAASEVAPEEPAAESEEPPIYPLSRAPEAPVLEKPAGAAATGPGRATRPPARVAIEPEPAPTDVYPLPRRKPAPASRPETATAVSDWVASFLFAILLVAGLGLAGYTLARPFLAH